MSVMDIGFPAYAETPAPDQHEGQAAMTEFWDEHEWALTGRQAGSIVAAVLALSALLSAVG